MANFDYTYKSAFTVSGDDIYIKYADANFSGSNWPDNSVSLPEQLLLNRFQAALDSTKTFFVYRNSNQKAFTANAGSDVITAAAHGLLNGYTTYVWGADLPQPLVQSQLYYIRDVTTDTFKLALTSDGAAINLTDPGSGVMFLISPSKRSINDEPDIGIQLASAVAELTGEAESEVAAAVVAAINADATQTTARTNAATAATQATTAATNSTDIKSKTDLIGTIRSLIRW